MSETASVTLPEWLIASPRTHNRLVRTAVEAECKNHIAKRLPGHFTQGAAAKYKHQKRKPKYIRYKIRRFHTGTDLVKSGATRAHVPQVAKIAMSGSASEGTIRGRITSRLPFGGGTGRTLDDAARRRMGLGAPSRMPTDGVTPAQMIKELKAVTREETKDMSNNIRRDYIGSIRKLSRPRLVTGAVLPTI